MNDLGIDLGLIFASEEVKLLEQLRELDIELQSGVERLADRGIHPKEKFALKERLIALSNAKSELASRIEAIAREEIVENNRKLKALSQSLVEEIDIGARSVGGKPSNVQRVLKATPPTDEDAEAICFCGQNATGALIECQNAYCKTLWYHIGCVGISGAAPKRWVCEECLRCKDVRLKEESR